MIQSSCIHFNSLHFSFSSFDSFYLFNFFFEGVGEIGDAFKEIGAILDEPNRPVLNFATL